MIILCASIIVIILIIILGIFIFKILNNPISKDDSELIGKAEDFLLKKEFYPDRIVCVNKKIILATDKNSSKIAAIEYNDKNTEIYNHTEIFICTISKIEQQGKICYINYFKQGIPTKLCITSTNEKGRYFIYEINKLSKLKKINEKFPTENFNCVTGSDWEISYLWAYNSRSSAFAYLKSDNNIIQRIFLKDEFCTIDTKYKYFETSIMHKPQQLYMYENSFLGKVYSSLRTRIIETAAPVNKDKNIYYDKVRNIVYLFGGKNCIQSVLMDEVEDISYKENRIYFSKKNGNKTINFIANDHIIKDFNAFIKNYNILKITEKFNYKTDKIINTTDKTKFIIDKTRSRVIYCANIDSIKNFSCIIVPFSKIIKAKVHKSGKKYFTRISLKSNDILDITCNKYEAGEYIVAEINSIIK